MTPDQTADLWLKIDQLHLNYLKSEENTSKLEIRKKLEGMNIIYTPYYQILMELVKTCLYLSKLLKV